MWFHKLGTNQSTDSCLYHEKDDTFSLDLEASESKKYLFVGSESKTTRSIFYLDISKPENGLMVLTPRLEGIDTSVSHRGNHFFIKRRSDEAFNSELLACPLNDVNATTMLLSHRERYQTTCQLPSLLLIEGSILISLKQMIFISCRFEIFTYHALTLYPGTNDEYSFPVLYFGIFFIFSVKIQDIRLFSDHLVVYEREKGLPRVTFYSLPAVGEPLQSLKGGQTVDVIDPVYSVEPAESQFSSSILRFSYSSLRTPSSTYDYDMNTGVSVLKKIETVSYMIVDIIHPSLLSPSLSSP